MKFLMNETRIPTSAIILQHKAMVFQKINASWNNNTKLANI